MSHVRVVCEEIVTLKMLWDIFRSGRLFGIIESLTNLDGNMSL